MMKFVQILLCYGLLLTLLFALSEARPSAGETGPDTDGLDGQEADDVRGAYGGGYEMPAQAIYPNIPMDRLQMLFAQYRPTSYSAYLRSPTYGNVNELYRLPESKRQVRYRQCYFNPISCFRK
ncbi:uncharacterized protein LOC108033401 isoform X1 [Drosophila biarmipes]|uniref:uncharacterized protein LOC108033401 isoform X1 n=1 Tax=Drosophila biarmipes TaxID=125945 RepID=UPI001CDAF5DE|nr:uncharacterized protein LOC108033401 isoform X1 [Drosophila biarmipes]XP_050740870.1 uncharacterized protein LOC108033401 isoform X1 [Drosophila biarmipes]XP_050740871.1 uncharacterized protein LOC108033401 isoform X1 [Drosophila biarmipes]